ncbi:hypothetical protein BJ741DRAFT_653295 [Chytriomyces cf. hyalinus JEL632]|nr:hypothetical protein BJ741DRAFT_653295 [Chytriomyces cf. hyalinus JEL632]
MDTAVSWLQDQLRAQMRENSDNTIKYAQCLERQTLVPRQMEAMKDDISELQDQIRLLVKRVSELESGRAANPRPLNPNNGSAMNGNPKTVTDSETAYDERIPHPPKESRPLKRTSTPDSPIPENTSVSKRRLTAPPSSSSSSASSPRPSVKTPTAKTATETPLLLEKSRPDLLADGSPNISGYRSWIQVMKSYDPGFMANASNRGRVDLFHAAFNLSKVEMKPRNTLGIPASLHSEFCEFMKSGWRKYAKQEKNQISRSSLAKAADAEKKIASAGAATAGAGNGATPAKVRRKSSVVSAETVDSDFEDCAIVDSGNSPVQKASGASDASQNGYLHASISYNQSPEMNSLTPKNKSTGALTPAQSNSANTHSGASPSTPLQHQLSPDVPSHKSGTTNTTATPKNDDLNKWTPSQNGNASRRLSNGSTKGTTPRENSQVSKSNTPAPHEESVNPRVAVQEKSQGLSSTTFKELPSDGHNKETTDRIPKGIKYVKIVRQVMPDYNELDKGSKSAIHAGIRDYLFEALGNNESRALKCVPPGFTLETSQMYWIPQPLVPDFQDWLYTQLQTIFPKSNIVKPAAAITV